jgi:hypothetical protein
MADQENCIFNCETCGKSIEQSMQDNTIPECCDKPMKQEQLPVCEVSSTAEHQRFDSTDDPCDDGRSGQA